MRSETVRGRLRGGLRPVGPARAITYWSRRVGALVVLGLLVFGAAWYLAHGTSQVPRAGGSRAALRAGSFCRGSEVAVRIVNASRMWSGSGGPAGTGVSVGTIGGPPAGAPSGPPVVTIQVTNHSRARCVLDAQQVGVVGFDSHGPARWMSASCGSAHPSATGLRILPASGSVSWTIIWGQAHDGPYCVGATLPPDGEVEFYGLAMGHLTKVTVLGP